jgi:hypothetical protein
MVLSTGTSILRSDLRRVSKNQFCVRSALLTPPPPSLGTAPETLGKLYLYGLDLEFAETLIIKHVGRFLKRLCNLSMDGLELNYIQEAGVGFSDCSASCIWMLIYLSFNKFLELVDLEMQASTNILSR